MSEPAGRGRLHYMHIRKDELDTYSAVKVMDLRPGMVFHEFYIHYLVLAAPKPNPHGGRYVQVHVRNDQGAERSLRKRADGEVAVLKRTLPGVR